MAKCENCGKDLTTGLQRFCSEPCRGIVMERARHGSRRQPGRTAAKRRRRRGR